MEGKIGEEEEEEEEEDIKKSIGGLCIVVLIEDWIGVEEGK